MPQIILLCGMDSFFASLGDLENRIGIRHSLRTLIHTPADHFIQ